MSQRRNKNGKFAFVLASVVVGMVGLAYASVPLYELFCQVTGYGGTPNTANVVMPTSVSDKTVKVRFDSNISPKLKWRFKPLQREVTVKLGEENLAFYEAENIGLVPLTGQAIFNVTPFKAAPYFSKIECFCFTEQTLEPGQVVSMPVQYFIDPEIYNDLNTREVSAITLSYTFYPADIDGDYPAELDEDETQSDGKINVSARMTVPDKG